MENYSLLQPSPVVPAPEGTRLILVRTHEGQTGWQVEHHILRVVGFQPTAVHHYTRDKAASVHPSHEMMDRHGWTYQHLEMRYAPVFIGPDGKLTSIDAHDPRWYLLEPGTPDDRVEVLAETLKAKEVERYRTERRLEEEDEVAGEVEED
jgi:hypothetical protein